MPEQLLHGLYPAHPYIANRLDCLEGLEPHDLFIRGRIAARQGDLLGYDVIRMAALPLSHKWWWHVIIFRNQETGAKLVLCTDDGQAYMAFASNRMDNVSASMILDALTNEPR